MRTAFGVDRPPVWQRRQPGGHHRALAFVQVPPGEVEADHIVHLVPELARPRLACRRDADGLAGPEPVAPVQQRPVGVDHDRDAQAVGLNVCGEGVEGRALEQREEGRGGVGIHSLSIYYVAVWRREWYPPGGRGRAVAGGFVVVSRRAASRPPCLYR